MPDCPGAYVLFRDPRGRCPRGCKKIVYEYWWADPDSSSRNDPDEICTVRDRRVYQRTKGPKPPAHYGCRCKRKFAFYICLSGRTKPPIYGGKRWNAEKGELE